MIYRRGLVCFALGLFFFQVSSWASATSAPNEVSYRILVDFDPGQARINGHETLTLTNHTGKSWNAVYLHLYPNAFRYDKSGTYMQERRKFEDPDETFLNPNQGSWMDVKGVKDGLQSLKTKVDRELMTVYLARPLLSGQAMKLDIDFITQIGEVAERSGTWDGNFAVAQWFPKLMVYDQDGWALKHNSGYHYVGEFYGDYGAYDVEIRAPVDFKIGATGHLLREKTLADGRKSHVFHAEPVRDFAWVADSKYQEETLTLGKVKIHVFYRHPSRAVIGEYSKNALEYYSKRIGPYPYEDYTVAETYYNGPMQYPQISFIRGWPQGLGRTLETGAVGLLELAVVHEAAHQWFYGVVGNNEVSDAWMDEGFTTYFEESYMRDHYGSEENLVRFSSLLKLTDRQLGDIIWRSQAPDVSQPIQTPSYQFEDPTFFYSSVYYRTANHFRHFEALIGQDQLDSIFHAYYLRNRFRNVRPEDWYGIVREMEGPEAERWWKDWINKVARCDYSIHGFSSDLQKDGGYLNRFRVAQEGQFFVPVDVELVDEAGVKTRVRVSPTADHPVIQAEVKTNARVVRAEVDPDHVTDDYDRFNNKPGILPDVEVLPLTTRTVKPDAITLAPLPYFNKSPGLGIETGVIVPMTHYLDWYGVTSVTYDWRFKTANLNVFAETLQPELDVGWTMAYELDQLVNRGRFYIKKSLGPEIGHDPRNELLVGPEYYGELGDGMRAAGLGGDYSFNNMAHGQRIGYTFTFHNSGIRTAQLAGVSDKIYTKVEFKANFSYKSYFYLRGLLGTILGSTNKSALYDLQADEEGRMRFDTGNVGLYRLKTIKSANLELHFPLPYLSWEDAVPFLYGPKWDWHLFGDFSNSATYDRTLMDFGIGTSMGLATGGLGDMSLNLELVPWQNASSTGFQSPILLLNFLFKGPGAH